MANFLGPYYVRLNYHSALLLHTMTIPTLTWNPGAGFGTFDTHLGATIDAQDMIEALVTLMLPFFNSTVDFDNWVIFKQLLPTDFPEPVASAAFTAMSGSNVGASWASGIEWIIVARTEGFGIAKLTLLDACSENTFTPRTSLIAPLDDLVPEWTSSSNGWAGRDNTKPGPFLKATVNLNQKLRKELRYD